MKRLLIVARDFNSAQHYAKERKMSPGQWVYVSSFHNVQGNAGNDYIKIKGCELRPDLEMLESTLKRCKCVEVTHPPM